MLLGHLMIMYFLASLFGLNLTHLIFSRPSTEALKDPLSKVIRKSTCIYLLAQVSIITFHYKLCISLLHPDNLFSVGITCDI